jgi:branched-chain amino acid transport system ATP-binding protein
MLAVSGFAVNYGPVTAVRDVAFEISEGESVAILGGNGAGKTTTVEAVAGLIPAAAGSVVFDGANIAKEPAGRIARMGLALVTQRRDLFPDFTVRETLLTARSAAGSREPSTIEEIFDLFPRLSARAGSIAANLSGGEQQMLAIGRALMTRPKLLVLDEPSSGLAQGVISVVVEALQRVRKTGQALLVVEQNLELASALTDRCLIMSVGRIAWQGSTEEAISGSHVQRAYFS